MEEMRQTASMEAVGSMIVAGQEAKKEILVKRVAGLMRTQSRLMCERFGRSFLWYRQFAALAITAMATSLLRAQQTPPACPTRGNRLGLWIWWLGPP